MKTLAVVVLALGCASGVEIEPTAGTCRDDVDGDGYIDSACGGVADDCNDHNPNTHRFGWEYCDGVDNDCDGVTDNDCHYRTTLLNPDQGDIPGKGGVFGCSADRPFLHISDPKVGGEATGIGFGDLFMNEDQAFWRDPTPVWYFGRDHKRYLVPFTGVFASWFGPGPEQCSRVRTVKAAVFKSIPVGLIAGGKVCYRPGSKIVKVAWGSGFYKHLYVIAHGCTIRALESEAVAEALYGPAWRDSVEVIPFAVYFNYFAGPMIHGVADYDAAAELEQAPTIDYNQVSL